MTWWGQIIFNIIGGAIVALLTWLSLWLFKRYQKYDFKKVFGKDISDNFFVVYGELKIRPLFEKDGRPVSWPYHKPGGKGFFNVNLIVSFTETKSAKYISETFGKAGGTSPKLVSDNEIKEKLDVSFLSIGGYNNFKTIDVLNCKENIYYDLKTSIDPVVIVAKGDKTVFSIKDNYDYGFIIKIRPVSFPNRTWIAVAGLGEWGTSGAVWYLSKNWKKLPKNKSFGMIIKVKGYQDESAEVVHKIVT